MIHGHHLPPSLRHPWEQYACRQCSPELYAAFTADVPTPTSDPAWCGICQETVKMEQGRFRKHFHDLELCRGAGLSEAVAEHLLDALIRGIGIAQFVREARAAGRTPRPSTLDRGDIVHELTQLRQRAGLTPFDLAAKAGVSSTNIYYWEAGKQPRVDTAVKWAASLGRRMVVRAGGVDTPVVSATAIASFLEGKRDSLGLTAAVVAKEARLPEETLLRWETGRASGRMTIADLADWSRGIDSSLELVESVDHE